MASVSEANLQGETTAGFGANSRGIPPELITSQSEPRISLTGLTDASELARSRKKFEIWAESVYLNPTIHDEIPGDREILHDLVKACFKLPRWLFDKVSIA